MTISSLNQTGQNSAEDDGARSTARLFSTMLLVAPEQCPRVVRKLASECDILLLRILLASKAVDACNQYRPQMVCALAPLLEFEENKQECLNLVSDWLKALDMGTPQKLGVWLPQVLLSEARILLQAFDADPLAIVPLDSVGGSERLTALGQVVASKEPGKAIEMLSALIRQGREPVVSFAGDQAKSVFGTVAEGHKPHHTKFHNTQIQNSYRSLMIGLDGANVPESWQYDAGRALLEYVTSGGAIDVRNDLALLEMMRLVRFDDPSSWIKLLQSGETPYTIPGALLASDHSALALRLIENMVRDQVDMDALSAEVYQDSVSTIMPWPHAAAAHDNPTIIEALLEAGCNYGIANHQVLVLGKTDRKTFECDALSVTEPGSVGGQMILAWKAKQSISSVVEKAVNAKGMP